jgi:hypothetical protein
MKQNSDETAKKTDAICTWVFGAMQGDTGVMASVKRRKTSMKWTKRPMQYAFGCFGAVQGIHVQWHR